MNEKLEELKNLRLEEKYKVLMLAFEKSCSLLRKEALPTMDWILEETKRLTITVGGTNRDPQGHEWMLYFLEKAMEEYDYEKND